MVIPVQVSERQRRPYEDLTTGSAARSMALPPLV
ncbi:hypothetical protein ABH935_008743 [Catenulispora sp. GAS73]